MRCAAPLPGVLVAVLLALPASAGVLTSATLTIDSPNLALGPVVFSGAAGGGAANGSGATATWTVQASALPTGMTSALLTAVPPLTQQVWTVGPNAAATFVAGGLNAMSIQAGWRIRSYGGITILGGGFATPLAVVFGSPNSVGPLTFSGIVVTGQGLSWTTGTTTVVLTTPTNGGLVSYTTQGSNGLVSGVGAVVLVTPYVISTSNATAPFGYFARLELHFVPEPGTGLLAMAAAALVGRAGRRRSPA